MKTIFEIATEDTASNPLEMFSKWDWFYIKATREDGKKCFIQICMRSLFNSEEDGIRIFVSDRLYRAEEKPQREVTLKVPWKELGQ